MGPCVRRDDDRSSSRIPAIFAKQIELLLHRAVGVAEQHAVVVRRQPQGLPRRHDEVVARGELEALRVRQGDLRMVKN